ncbi:MAG: radical SAM protein, partial [Deltaproteobacteria bacterium]|nr:radical SAM protein [Deltaproteobacteria bacterium]
MAAVPETTRRVETKIDGSGKDVRPRALPADCAWLPLGEGELLVSRGHAVFCRVPAAHVAAVRSVLAGETPLSTLAPPLLEALERHGFFGPPRAAPPESPSVQLQLTNACNIACRYCCTNSGHARAPELPLERYTAIVEAVRRDLGPRARVAVLGGEPFLLPWAIDLCERTVDLDLQLTIFTNGMPLGTDPALAARAGALTRRGAQLRISLAGPTKEICDAVSGADRFEGALAGVHAVARAGGEAILDLMLLPQHVDEVAGHLPELRKQLPPGTRIALGVLYLSGRETGEHMFRSRAELERALDRVAFEAGERIAAIPDSPVTERREGCSCALGQHLHVR